jgi:hypothetical protein
VDPSAAVAVLAIAENGLTFVVLGTVAFSLLMGVLFLVTGGTDSLYDQIGQGGLSREGDDAPGGTQAPDSAAARAEQEQEIRQMLGARNERLLRRGEPALDIDAELARLMEPVPERTGHDAGLVEEVRQLVIARNERRVRQGLSELDVESEVQRTLAELDP